MFKVIQRFEVITDYGYHLGLREGDLLHKVDSNKFRLDGTGHVFSVPECYIEEI
jgi:hypothetical protein